MNVQPVIQILHECPGQYFQRAHSGQVDYIIFGCYAYGRMLDPGLTNEIWNDQGEELSHWIRTLSQADDGHGQKLFDSI